MTDTRPRCKEEDMPSADQIAFIQRLFDSNRSRYLPSEIDTIDYQETGNFKIAVVSMRRDPGSRSVEVAVGVCKRNPAADKPDWKRGREISLARALRANPLRIPIR
jgi:hypothetical protein